MKKPTFLSHFNWKILLIRIMVNAFAVGLVALLVPDIYFVEFTLLNALIIGLALGILNALVKPALMFLTAQFFFATFGLLVILINAFILVMLDWIFPQIFYVQGLLWAIIGGALLGLVSNALENLFGVYPPIIPNEEVALRQRILAQSVSPIQSLVGSPTKRISPDVETQSLEELQAAQATLQLINENAPPPESTPTSPVDLPVNQPDSEAPDSGSESSNVVESDGGAA
jgi:putative membrane protein